ncbi:hypothetical protein HY970_03360 [Candidatus Kaiserbacteria bacterium]|nr:hypothetical protein [Candidatus Kaiserbacteria bacterium]
MKSRARNLWWLLLASIVLTFFIVGIAEASHSWGGYHWARSSNPFTLKLGDNVSTVWKNSLNIASADWSLSNILGTNIVPGMSNSRNCKPASGRVEVCSSAYGNTGWLGVAQIWVSGSHITQGTVKVNDTYFKTPTYNTPAWRQFVMCQEIGHTFGLDHQDEDFSNPNLGTCMDYTNDPARDDGVGTNLHPNQHDQDQLALIYAHFDAATTIRSSAKGNAAEIDAEDVSTPDQWGREVRKSKDGRSSLLERDLGKGKKVFTFVIWAQ